MEVSDDEIEEAMRLYFTATHNVAEGAGAAALAAALQEQSLIRERNASPPVCACRLIEMEGKPCSNQL